MNDPQGGRCLQDLHLLPLEGLQRFTRFQTTTVRLIEVALALVLIVTSRWTFILQPDQRWKLQHASSLSLTSCARTYKNSRRTSDIHRTSTQRTSVAAPLTVTMTTAAAASSSYVSLGCFRPCKHDYCGSDIKAADESFRLNVPSSRSAAPVKQTRR